MKNSALYTFFAVLLLVSFTFTGCGIKPSELQSPNEAERDIPFPSTYPHKATIHE